MNGMLVAACDNCIPGSFPYLAFALLLLGAVLVALPLLFLQQDSHGAARVVLLAAVVLIAVGVPRAFLTVTQRVSYSDGAGMVECGRAWTVARTRGVPDGSALDAFQRGCQRRGQDLVDHTLQEGAILGTLAVVAAGAGLVLRRRARRA